METLDSDYPVYDLLILGAGHAGASAALAARDAAPEMRIALLGEEVWLPYERPALSKEALAEDWQSDMHHKVPRLHYDGARIELLLGVRATALDCSARLVHGSDGRRYGYRDAVIATGSRVRPWPAPLEAHDGLVYLRTIDDALALRARLRPGARVVVIGAGFVGLEVAAAACRRGATVRVIDRAGMVLARVFTPAASSVVEKMHRRHGVDFELGADIRAISRSGDAWQVETAQAVHEADLVVVGIGVVPNVELAVAAGLAVDNGLLVDAFGRTSDAHVFGAGEVTRHPVRGGASARIESWQVAEQQARCAGATAAGQPTEYKAVPWFWSDQFDMNIQALGDPSRGGLQVLRGDAGGPHVRFVVGERSRIQSAVTFDCARDISPIRRLIERDIPVDPARLADTSVSFKELLAATV